MFHTYNNLPFDFHASVSITPSARHDFVHGSYPHSLYTFPWPWLTFRRRNERTSVVPINNLRSSIWNNLLGSSIQNKSDITPTNNGNLQPRFAGVYYWDEVICGADVHRRLYRRIQEVSQIFSCNLYKCGFNGFKKHWSRNGFYLYCKQIHFCEVFDLNLVNLVCKYFYI